MVAQIPGSSSDGPSRPRRRYLPAVGPRLKRLLGVVFGLFALLAVNAGYLVSVTAFDPPAPYWSIAWFTGLVNKQNGFLDEAIANFESILALDDQETRQRCFDFRRDHRLLNELGQTLFERAKQERGTRRQASRTALLEQARDQFLAALQEDPENVTAHYNLDLIFKQLDQRGRASDHFDSYQKYRPDDNARDRAVAVHRAAHPPANHAAEAIVIYNLQRQGAP
jgi:tetratricopeptide (TPR) repeat protein